MEMLTGFWSNLATLCFIYGFGAVASGMYAHMKLKIIRDYLLTAEGNLTSKEDRVRMKQYRLNVTKNHTHQVMRLTLQSWYGLYWMIRHG